MNTKEELDNFEKNINRLSRMSSSKNTTALDSELKMFQSFATCWWELDILQTLNEIRIPYIQECLSAVGKLPNNIPGSDKPLRGFNILDVGCGGGIVSEPLVRSGANVTGLDFCPELINVAKEHAKKDASLQDNLQYVCGKIEDFCEENIEKFDIVIAYEILDHIQNVPLFIKCCCKVLKPGGSIFFSTINRTTKSWLVAIILYEYIWGIIPRGSHHWNQFVQPVEIQNELTKYNCEITSRGGTRYSYFGKNWYKTDDTSVFFHVHAVKK